MSVCKFPEEFTCMSGACVNIFKKCDNIKDCGDGSDEAECSLLKIPAYYDKSAAPKLGDDVTTKANEIYVKMKIINFDSIEPLSDEVGLTVEIRFEWLDPNIDFEDAKNSEGEINEFNIVPEHQIGKIWLPINHLVYDNAVVGEIIKDDVYTLGVIIKSSASERNADESKESLIYPGIKNPLVAIEKMKMKYRCARFGHYRFVHHLAMVLVAP